MNGMNSNVIAIVREGFSQPAKQELPEEIHRIDYAIGDSFQLAWIRAGELNPKYVLLADSAITLNRNLYWLMIRILESNPTVDGITFKSEGLHLVYGLNASESQNSRYSVQKSSVIPSWCAMLRAGSWKGSAMATPEFFLLEQSKDKTLLRIDTHAVEFDTLQWAGDLIAFSAKDLALDYEAFLTTGKPESVPPQYRVTIPGKGNSKKTFATAVPDSILFSIICPSIRPEFLPEAVESVMHQEYPHWELLIGIDGPKESIRRKIQEVLEPFIHDRRIIVDYCEHMGTGPMRSHLSRKAQGQYLVGLDDDDRLMPNTLKRFAATIMKDPDTAVVRGGIRLFGLVDEYLPARIRYKIDGISNDLFEANQPYAVSKASLEALGGLEWDKDLKNAGEDSDLLLKVDREDLKLAILDEPLYERRLSTYNQTLDCTAEECLSHVHNLYNKHNPRSWMLNDINLRGQGARIRMLTRHKSAENPSQVVCSTEFMNFQQVGNREGVVLDLELTSLCNADCTFCPRDKLDRTSKFMSLDIVRRVADSLKSAKIKPTVVLCGIGESTLHPELTDIISILSKARANVCMTTNGWTLTEEFVDKLVLAELSELNVSLNAASPATHEHIMRLKHFDKIINYCNHIAQLRHDRWPHLKFHVSFVLTQENFREVDEFVDFWSRRNVSRIWLHPLTNRAGQISENCKPAEIDNLSAKFSGNPKVLVDLFPGNGMANLCHIAKQVDFLSVEGNMLLCAQDYAARHKFGNIAYENLDSLHQNKLLRHLRGETAETCSKCSFCPDGFKVNRGGAYTIVQAKDY